MVTTWERFGQSEFWHDTGKTLVMFSFLLYLQRQHMFGVWDAQTNECMNLVLPWWRKAKAMSVQSHAQAGLII